MENPVVQQQRRGGKMNACTFQCGPLTENKDWMGGCLREICSRLSCWLEKKDIIFWVPETLKLCRTPCLSTRPVRTHFFLDIWEPTASWKSFKSLITMHHVSGIASNTIHSGFLSNKATDLYCMPLNEEKEVSLQHNVRKMLLKRTQSNGFTTPKTARAWALMLHIVGAIWNGVMWSYNRAAGY